MPVVRKILSAFLLVLTMQVYFDETVEHLSLHTPWFHYGHTAGSTADHQNRPCHDHLWVLSPVCSNEDLPQLSVVFYNLSLPVFISDFPIPVWQPPKVL
ncbi:MAG: hypothetical protein M9948_06215 [Lentimicrobium sp.]|nr:hypothetical protein [Lentimicrobium sp.]